MKVIILAGGWGSRLGQLSSKIPKPMVKIGNKPILWHIMKVYSFYGYRDFIIALGVKGEIIKDYFYNDYIFTHFKDESNLEKNLLIGFTGSASLLMSPLPCLIDTLKKSDAIEKDRFLVTPHSEVLEYVKRKGTDRDRWISGMQRLHERFEGMIPD